MRREGRPVDMRPKANEFYTDEAARLASEAAKRRTAPQVAPRVRLPDGPVIFTGRERPPLKPAQPSNQNTPRDDLPSGNGIARRIAWAILLPWYVAVTAASIGLIVLIARLAAHI